MLSRLALRTASSSRLAGSARAAQPLFAAAVASRMVAVPAQIRGLKSLDFGGSKENVVERSDYPKAKFTEVFKKDTLCMLGYGTQGRGQALNLRDNGLNVIVGVRKGGKGSSWEKAVADGWVEGKNLFEIDAALKKGTVIMYLLSDAGQKQMWSKVQPYLTKGKTLYVAHGFSLVFNKDTGALAWRGPVLEAGALTTRAGARRRGAPQGH